MRNCRQRAREREAAADSVPLDQNNNRGDVTILLNPFHPLRLGVEEWENNDPVLAIAPQVAVQIE